MVCGSACDSRRVKGRPRRVEGNRDRPKPVPRANAYTGYPTNTPAKQPREAPIGAELEQAQATLGQAASMGPIVYMAVASLVFALVFGGGAALIVRSVVQDSRASIKELAATLGGELRAERTAHTEKIVTMTHGLRDSIAAFLGSNASQIGQLIAANASNQRDLVAAMDLRAERFSREILAHLETTTAALDANTRTMARTEKALDHHPRGRANGG